LIQKKAYDEDVNNLFNGTENLLEELPAVLVISKQGTQRESLDLVLRTLQTNSNPIGADGSVARKIGELKFLDDISAAVAEMAELKPAMVIVDTMGEDTCLAEQLKTIKNQFPMVKFLVLADIALWQVFKKLPYLDGLLLKGFSSLQLTKLIGKLLDKNDATSGMDVKEKTYSDQENKKGAEWIG
jgi:hypothetical protein